MAQVFQKRKRRVLTIDEKLDICEMIREDHSFFQIYLRTDEGIKA